MRKGIVALFAAGALVATGPVVAQTRAADPVPVRTGAQMEEESDLRGRGIIIPTLAIVGVILLLLALTDTWPFDKDESVSP